MDFCDTAVFGEVAHYHALNVVYGRNFAIFCSDFEANKNGFFELTNAFAGNTEEFTDLFERFFTVKKPKATSNDFSFTLLVD